MKILIDLQGAQSQSHRRGIGRYTREATKALIKRADAHEIHLALSSTMDEATDALLAEFSPYTDRERIHYLRLPYGTADSERNEGWTHRAASRLMRHALEQVGADAIWHSSVFEGLFEDAVVPDRPLPESITAATLYDLIPLHDDAVLLHSTSARSWYHSRLQYLRRCDLLLAISEWSRQDAITRLALPPDRVATIGAAADPKFSPTMLSDDRRSSLRSRIGITRPFVFYSGGLDPRKNVGALVQAFALLDPELRDRHQLVIAGSGEQAQQRLRVLAKRLELPPDAIRLPGFVSDEDLVALYSECAAFAFPSRMEGFGLPPLEAMACGAPVVCSSATSLPEVVGRPDCLFDPERPREICERLAPVLADPGHRMELAAYSLRRSTEFSWNSVADRALRAMEALAEDRQRKLRGGRPLASPSKLVCVGQEARLPNCMTTLPSGFELSVAGPDTAGDVDEAASYIYVVDSDSSQEMATLVQRPGIALLRDEAGNLKVPATEAERRRLYEFGGYHRLPTGPFVDRLVNALPVLKTAAGVLAESPGIKKRLLDLGVPGDRVASCTDSPELLASALDRWFRATRNGARESALISEIARLPGSPNDDDLAQAAYVISAARPRDGQRWLVDVSSISRRDLGTGIQQVVRNIVGQWLRHPPDGVRIEPVRFHDGHYRYARRYACELLGIDDLGLDEGLVSARRGDVFIGLDWAVEMIGAASERIADWRRGGVECRFVVYDLLPLTMPEHFHPFSVSLFEQWLHHVVYLSDGIACISRTTAEDLSKWLDAPDVRYQFGNRPSIDSFVLGVAPPRIPSGVPELRSSLHGAVDARPSLLMVGTLEPRKRHAAGLAIADYVWKEGIDANLIIVGHRGWLTEDLIDLLENHPERNRRLFWFEDVGNGELHTLYARCDALLALSSGEGHALPLIEAAQHGLPIFASDLPVFREIVGSYPHYLRGTTNHWAPDVAEWLRGPRLKKTPPSMPGWDESANELGRLVSRLGH